MELQVTWRQPPGIQDTIQYISRTAGKWMAFSQGEEKLAIGLVDGPIDFNFELCNLLHARGRGVN